MRHLYSCAFTVDAFRAGAVHFSNTDAAFTVRTTHHTTAPRYLCWQTWRHSPTVLPLKDARAFLPRSVTSCDADVLPRTALTYYASTYSRGLHSTLDNASSYRDAARRGRGKSGQDGYGRAGDGKNTKVSQATRKTDALRSRAGLLTFARLVKLQRRETGIRHRLIAFHTLHRCWRKATRGAARTSS